MKKVVTILFIIMFFITIIQIRDTYALYRARIAGEYQTLLGVWSVKVNETDLSSGSADLTFEIPSEYLHFEENEFVDGKYIAPGSEGYFDLLIDATDTDVSIKYNVRISDSASLKIGEEVIVLTDIIPIELLGVEETFIKGEEIDTNTEHTSDMDFENKVASGVIPLSVIDEGYNGKIRVHFKWKNDDTSNEFHTMLGNAEIGNTLSYTTGMNTLDSALIEIDDRPSIVIPVSLELIQYMGEEVVVPVTTP